MDSHRTDSKSAHDSSEIIEQSAGDHPNSAHPVIAPAASANTSEIIDDEFIVQRKC